MTRVFCWVMVLCAVVGSGCTAEDIPEAPYIGPRDLGPIGRPRTDSGPRDSATDATDAAVASDAGVCLAEPADVRILFMLDRSQSMSELTEGGMGPALNVLASNVAVELLGVLPETSLAGALLFPSQSFVDPDCADVDPLGLQYPLRGPLEMGGTLNNLWASESLILSTPRATALDRAAEALADNLSDVWVVMFTDAAAGCGATDLSEREAVLRERGARVTTVTLGTVFSSISVRERGLVEPLRVDSNVAALSAELLPILDSVRRRCAVSTL